jgi:hypothetical protein
MIAPGINEFPNNVIALVATRAETFLDPDEADPTLRPQVFKRPLRPSDGAQVVGIFPSMKRPVITTIEMQSQEPTLKRYSFIMQTMVQNTDEEECISVHSILSNRLWRMFYRDSPLGIGLTALAVVADNSRERFQRRGVELQRYLSNEINGSFVETSWIECWFETETVGNP